MKNFNFIIVTVWLLVFATAKADDFEQSHASVQKLNVSQRQEIQKYSWHLGCPVPISALRSVTVNYWGFDAQSHQGILIVNQSVANQVFTIFQKLYLAHFPIEKIRPIDAYEGNDAKAMADNDTSAFNCRKMIGSSTVFSQHAYGLAIDINPIQNPYIKQALIMPPKGKNYLDRNANAKGLINKNNIAYQIFHQYGWEWGGSWHIVKDYQHFQRSR